MRFMMLRRSDRDHEAGLLPGPETILALNDYRAQLAQAGVLQAFERLLPTEHGVRLKLSLGRTTVIDGPFFDTKELIAGFAVIDVASREDALAWLARWPSQDGGGNALVALRESGCPGGCAEVRAGQAEDAGGKRFVILLRSSEDLENEVELAQQRLDRLDAHNAAEARAGVLLAADGLRSTARATRARRAGGKMSLIDGPFTEIKELIAGYWMIRVPALQDAIDWAMRNPYPSGPEIEVEIRQVQEASDASAFTPALRAAEPAMRDQQLDSALRTQLAATPPAWR